MGKTIKFNFCYNGINEIIEHHIEGSMFELFEKYLTKVGKDFGELYFLYNGNLLNPEIKIEEIGEINDNVMILAFEFENQADQNDLLKQSNDIICPICKEICIMYINDYKITFKNCKNNHKFSNILFNEFKDFQQINESKIVCNNCENNKNETNKNQFYKCCHCNINLCPLCKSSHQKQYKDESHTILNYDLKNYYCQEHGERYICHSNIINKDFCDQCNYNYNDNNTCFLYKIIKKTDNNLNELKSLINDLKNENINSEDLLSKVIENLEIYYQFSTNIFNNFETNPKNFYILNTINNINEYTKKIIEDINKIKNEKNIGNKISYLSEIIKKMNINNEFILKYKLGDIGIIRILGEPFVKMNKNNFQLIINDKNYELTSILNIIDIKNGYCTNDFIGIEANNVWEYISKEIKKKEKRELTKKEKLLNSAPKIEMNITEILEIKLKQLKSVTDISYMFSGCQRLKSIEISNWTQENILNMESLFCDCISLTSLPDISNFITNNVKSMNNLFSKCYLLTSLPDISNWNTDNITDMSYMFSYCHSLKSLPDISKWQTNNVVNMHYMFNECWRLKSLPDISKWNTMNLENISFMFNKCESLKLLPEISNWNMDNVNNMNSLFKDCEELISLPDISKWNISNVINMSEIFSNYQSKSPLPDISKWNTSNVTKMYSIFNNYQSNNPLPDISNWDTSNVTDMRNIFSNYKSNNPLPDISKWDTSNVTDMSEMFLKYSSLSSLPDISKWNTSKVERMYAMFCNCESVMSIPDISNWNTESLTNIKDMFRGCKSLKYFPDVSKWNISKLNDHSKMFEGCESLESIPNIFKN